MCPPSYHHNGIIAARELEYLYIYIYIHVCDIYSSVLRDFKNIWNLISTYKQITIKNAIYK